MCADVLAEVATSIGSLHEFRAPSQEPVRVKPGVVRLLRKPICPCELIAAGVAGILTINGVPYELYLNATLPPEAGEPVIHGYCLKKITGEMYDLPASLDGCDCPDQIFRRDYHGQRCKHIRAITALRNAGKIV